MHPKTHGSSEKSRQSEGVSAAQGVNGRGYSQGRLVSMLGLNALGRACEVQFWRFAGIRVTCTIWGSGARVYRLWGLAVSTFRSRTYRTVPEVGTFRV